MRAGLKYLIPIILFSLINKPASSTPKQKLESNSQDISTEYHESRQNQTTPVSKEDVTINFLLGTYSVGDPLNYTGEVKNLTSKNLG